MKIKYYLALSALCCWLSFVPSLTTDASSESTSMRISFLNDAPLPLIPELPNDIINNYQNEESTNEMKQKLLFQSLFPKTGEIINKKISLLGVAISLCILIIYLYKKRKKGGER